MSVKELSLYVAYDSITVRRNHLPFKKLLQKTTLNVKVNNQDVELSDYNIKFIFKKLLKHACTQPVKTN